MKKTENIGGYTFETYYDRRYKNIDLELVRVVLNDKVLCHEEITYYQINIEATTKNKKIKNILKLHIKDAIELKSIIDNLVYDANQDAVERLKWKPAKRK